MSTEIEEIQKLIYVTVIADVNKYLSKTSDQNRSPYVSAWLADSDQGEIENPAYLIGQQEYRVIRRALSLTKEDDIKDEWLKILRQVEHDVWVAKRNELRAIVQHEGPKPPEQRSAREVSVQPEVAQPIVTEIKASSRIAPGGVSRYSVVPTEIVPTEIVPTEIHRPQEQAQRSVKSGAVDITGSIDEAPADIDPERCMQSLIPNADAIQRDVAQAIDSYDASQGQASVISLISEEHEKISRALGALESAVSSSNVPWLARNKRAISGVLGVFDQTLNSIKGFLRKLAGVHSKQELSQVEQYNSELELKVNAMKQSLGIALEVKMAVPKKTTGELSQKQREIEVAKIWEGAAYEAGYSSRPLAPGAGIKDHAAEKAKKATRVLKDKAREITDAVRTQDYYNALEHQKFLLAEQQALQETSRRRHESSEMVRSEDAISRIANERVVAEQPRETEDNAEVGELRQSTQQFVSHEPASTNEVNIEAVYPDGRRSIGVQADLPSRQREQSRGEFDPPKSSGP